MMRKVKKLAMTLLCRGGVLLTCTMIAVFMALSVYFHLINNVTLFTTVASQTAVLSHEVN